MDYLEVEAGFKFKTWNFYKGRIIKKMSDEVIKVSLFDGDEIIEIPLFPFGYKMTADEFMEKMYELHEDAKK